jgi:asparagine synthase (glutamine-hydrolysing)
MVADVPVGAFLSGGVDSSLIVSLMQACSSRPVKTFSIGFAEASYNEAPFAEKIAKHLGTDHTELILDAKQAHQVIPKLPVIYDEPFADSSQIPTFLVSQLASQYVRVALTGDAGDEVFAGYPRQQLIARMRRLLAIPSPLRRALGGALSLAPDRMRRFHKLGAVVKQPNARAMFAALASHWPQGSNPVLAVDKSSTVLDLDSHWPSAPYLEQIIYLDSVTYLPDDILVKVDRAAMANSLETRVPFLDHELMEFVWNLPLRMRVRGNIGKWVLKQILSEYVSRDLFERPKSGFSIPLGEWLRGDLRDWAEDLLSERRLREDGYFDAHRVRSAWHAHLSGADLEHKLWNILAFQAWLRGVGVSQRSAHA